MKLRLGLTTGAIAVVTTSLAAGCVAVATDGTPMTSRTAAKSHAASASVTSTAARGEKTACQLITPAVIQAAHFPDRVINQMIHPKLGADGRSICAYGDDPNPAVISPSFMFLGIVTPKYLAAHRTTAKAEAKESFSPPCPGKDVREFGANVDIGSYSYFCVVDKHSPAGAWVQGSNVYVLEVGYPTVDYGTAKERETEFESVARAIAKNLGG